MVTRGLPESVRADTGKCPKTKALEMYRQRRMFKAQWKDIKEHLCLCKSASSLFLNPGIWVKGETFPFESLHGAAIADQPPWEEARGGPYGISGDFLEKCLSLGGTLCFLFHACCQWTKSETRGDARSENVLSCDPSSLPLPLASLLSLRLSRGDAKACH